MVDIDDDIKLQHKTHFNIVKLFLLIYIYIFILNFLMCMIFYIIDMNMLYFLFCLLFVRIYVNKNVLGLVICFANIQFFLALVFVLHRLKKNCITILI